MTLLHSLIGLLVFPGVLFALPIGWLMLGTERKTRARLQGRIGPPLMQPFWDLVKLLAKSPAARNFSDTPLLTGLPLLAAASMLGVLAMLPVFGQDRGFAGDLIVIIALLEMPPLCLILAGYASRSIYGEVGATREGLVMITSNVPFLAAIVAMAAAAGSFRIATIGAATPWTVRVPALLTILLCLPVKLRMNPFSLANAEQELLAGPLTEFDGPRLGLWELAHSLEWVALTGFVAVLAWPSPFHAATVNGIAFVAISFLLVLFVTVIASATARIKIRQATRLLGTWATALAGVALMAAILARKGVF
jgi:NADH-quinone oxidoreductase subunit H